LRRCGGETVLDVGCASGFLSFEAEKRGAIVLETDELVVRPALPMTDPAQDITWWIYSRGLYNRIFENVGFELIDLKNASAYCEYTSKMVTRSTIVARRKTRSQKVRNE